MASDAIVKSVSHSHAHIYGAVLYIKNEFVYGGHLTALGAPMKVLFMADLLGIGLSAPLLLIAYLGALSVYSADYYRSIDKDRMTNPGRAAFLSGRAVERPYLIYIALLLVSLALFANAGLFITILALTFLGVMYTAAFKGVTRKVPGFKNAFTSGIWASGVSFGLLSYYSLSPGPAFALVFLFLFMRSMGNTIFFDIKDIESDASEGLRTLPVLLGPWRTIRLLKALNVLSFLPLAVGALSGILPHYALFMLALAAFTHFNLGRSGVVDAKRSGYMYYMLADLETLSWPVLLALGKAIFSPAPA
jgi:4-hydroxybenzoate polyprenyltransferase